MKDAQRKGSLPDFKFIEINGMRLQKPEQAYCILWEALAQESVSPKKALSKLEEYFERKSKNKSHKGDKKAARLLVLVDELDHMRTKSEMVGGLLLLLPPLPCALHLRSRISSFPWNELAGTV